MSDGGKPPPKGFEKYFPGGGGGGGDGGGGNKKNSSEAKPSSSSSSKPESTDGKNNKFEFELKFGGNKKSSSSNNDGEKLVDWEKNCKIYLFKKNELKMHRSSTDQQKAFLLFAAGVALVMGLSFMNDRYQEINWRDFTNEYLIKGNVDRLEVVNKKWVRIIAKSPGPVID